MFRKAKRERISKMYRYETHLHTFPVSACAKASVRECLEFYKSEGYDGVFITNHFLDGNINYDKSRPYEEQLDFYVSDYYEGKKIGEEIGLKVFFAPEITYRGTDFLVFGLDIDWYYAHPEIMDMKKSEELPYLGENGALVVHAHPFREAKYIDHIRLFPRGVQGCETLNACRTDFENKMAQIYAENYGFFQTAGSDNHVGSRQMKLAGMESEIPVTSEKHFVELVKSGEMKIFCYSRKE